MIMGKKHILFGAALLAIFYLLPLLIRDTGSAMLVLLCLMPLLCLLVSFLAGRMGIFHWLWAPGAMLAFLPSLPLYYNSSAWVYAPVYGLLVLLGGGMARGRRGQGVQK